MFMSESSKVLGKGDFGTVSKVRLQNPPGTPESPLLAVKEIEFDTRGVCSSDLQDEVRRLGSPGCVTGVACRAEESALIFMPLGITFKSLDFSKMTKEVLEWVIQSVKNICTKKLDIGILGDIKPENFIVVPKGTATVVKDAKGQPCMGPPTEHDEVVYCDLGSVDPTSGGTKIYGVLPSKSEAEKPDFETKLRTFKVIMMEALIRDAANPSGKTVEQIVAPLVPQEWAYAAGVQHQTQGF
jgi:serine/threonine protein kinase